MEQTLSRYGNNAETADHKQREQQQLLLCSYSHQNGVVVCVSISISSDPLYCKLLYPFCYMDTVVAVPKR